MLEKAVCDFKRQNKERKGGKRIAVPADYL